MSLEQSINYGKEHRKQYHGAKAVDPSCRNHGECVYCKKNRLHKKLVEELSLKDKEDSWTTQN